MSGVSRANATRPPGSAWRRAWLTVFIGGILAARLLVARDDSLPPWHQYLGLLDARFFLVWASALPTVAALSFALGGGRRRRGIFLTLLALLFQVGAIWAIPHLSESALAAYLDESAIAFLALTGGFGLLGRTLGAKRRKAVYCFIVCSILGVAVCGRAGWSICNLPPDLHDEYAYLFQAWTFLDGRIAYPADDLAPAFDQVHILNRGVRLSRYFPGTGLWLAPFAAIDRPMWGMWLCSGLIAGFTALAGRRFSPTTGYLAGVTTATTPGVVGLCNMLLSPGPTMLAMAVFYWSFPAVLESRRLRWPIVAGLAIGFAFLCRPLTAVGLGFPYAAYCLYRWRCSPPPGYAKRLAALIAAFSSCLLGLACFNLIALGTPFETPYGRYTATVTPSHVYGFYNRERGDALRGPETLAAYDAWAEDLTPPPAAAQSVRRCQFLLRLGLGGSVTFSVLLLLGLIRLPRDDDRVLLLWLSIAGLSFAYTPYWFSGADGYGYIAESMPAVVLLAASATTNAGRRNASGALSLFGTCWIALLASRSLLNVTAVLTAIFAPGADMVFPRIKKQELIEAERRIVHAELAPLLVLVDSDPKDAVHTTLVNNQPRLDGEVVRAWYRPELLERLLARFPDRCVYVLRYNGFNRPYTWRRLRGPIVRER